MIILLLAQHAVMLDFFFRKNELITSAHRIDQVPKALEPVDVPASRTAKFKPGRLMKKAMDDGAKRSDD